MINIGFHHFYKRKQHGEQGGEIFKTIVSVNLDKIIYAGGFAGVVFSIPQVMTVWIGRNVAGLSLITWISFFVGTLFWLFYAIVHKEKPMMVINLAFSILNFLVVIGIILFR